MYSLACGALLLRNIIAGRFFQLPAGLDTNNPVVMKSAMETVIAQAPQSAMLTMVAGYFIAAFGGGFHREKDGR